MSGLPQRWFPLLAVAVLALETTGLLYGQERAEVTARLEPSRIELGETADLVVEVEPSGLTQNVPEPSLPDLPATVVGQTRESRVSLSDGEVSRRVVYRYRLRPMATGRLRIDPIRVDVGGRTLETPALDLEVIRPPGDGLAAEAGGGLPAFFATARVDRERAYVGEQITLTFAFYHDPRAALAESPDYDPPSSPGFWRVEVDSAPRVQTERIGSRVFHVQRFRYALFPLRSGRLEVGSASVRILEPDPVEWWRPGRPRTLRTDALQIQVDPLPEGAPLSHDGAVGRFELEGVVSDRSAMVGVPVELTLAVKGVGNPMTVGEPALPAWPDVAVTKAGAETATRVRDGVVRGEASFTYLLSPAQAGPLDLGQARLAYFDPGRRAYVVDSLDLGEIEVQPSAASVAAGPDPGEGGREGPTLWPARRPIDPRPETVPTWYWGALVGPWLAWLALIAWRRRPAPAPRPGEAVKRFAERRKAARTAGGRGLDSALRAMDEALAATWPDGPPEDVADLAAAARRAVLEAEYGRASSEEAERGLYEVERRLRGRRRSRGGSSIGIALLAVGVSVSIPALALAQDETDWDRANAAYRAGDFERAIALYADLATRHDDPHLEADLAAALWRADRRGEAVVHYQRALASEPRNDSMRADLERLRADLGLARGQSATDVLKRARLDELLWLLLAAATIGFVAFATTGGGRKIGLAVLAGTALIATTVAARAWIGSREMAVALRPVAVAAAPGGAPIVELAEGAEVRVLEAGDTSWRVRAPGRPAGWVPAGAVERISSP
ncbi:MAG: BatD family protein [Gemmatimonadota bacterium]